MADDPYRYFRLEARDLLQQLNQGVLELEKGPAGRAVFEPLLRHAHTLKGASRVVKLQAIGDAAHAIEDALAPFVNVGGAVPRASVTEILRLLDGIALELSNLDPAAPTSDPRRTRSAGEEDFETMRVELGEMDALLEGVGDLASQFAALEREISALDGVRRDTAELRIALDRGGAVYDRDQSPGGRERSDLARELEGRVALSQRSLDVRVEQASRALLQIREWAGRLRLVPVSMIFTSLERAARDAAQSLDKQVEFNATDGDSRLDAHVLGALRDALLHVVRNAVAHGIEAEPERVRSGKAPVGRIELSIERRSNWIAFRCRDDGRGIDIEAVRQAALRKRILSPANAAAMSAEDVTRLVLTSGVSTSETVTDVSGRGVGLDVVRETASRLKGDVKVTSVRGRGTTIEIAVPVSLTSVPAILVEAVNVVVAIPLDAAPGVRRLGQDDFARTADGATVMHESTTIPFVNLSAVLSREGSQSPMRPNWTSVIVRSGDSHVALGVDRILGASNVVVRHIPPWVATDPAVGGIALDLDGSPQVVLDPEGLLRTPRRGARQAGDEMRSRPPVLVIDDSLTTRMLEQSVLESSGYEVDLAVSAEDALERARTRAYGLFLVDVEMPGMDGFEFIARIRSDPLLHATPAILVTSRNAERDRRRGEQVGATAYIVKSEFNQKRMLKIIGDLIG